LSVDALIVVIRLSVVHALIFFIKTLARPFCFTQPIHMGNSLCVDLTKAE